MKKIVLGILIGLICSGANAVSRPASHIKVVSVDDVTPIYIDMVRGEPCVIEFGAGEALDDIAVSGTDNWRLSWEIVKRGTRLFVRQFGGNDAERSVIVTTPQHSYVLFFEPGHPQTFVSKLLVTFEKPLPALPSVEIPEQPLRQPVFTRRNYAYSMEIVSESVDIRPRAAWDDGRFTYLTFPNAVPIPAIYRTVPGTGEEALVDWHIEGDTVVLHAISPGWNLRMGTSVIGVFNERYDGVGISTPNGTTTSQVRVIK